MRGRLYRIIAVSLIAFGVLVNFLPVTSYYFGTYVHIPYKGNIRNGSTLDYYISVGPFGNNTTPNVVQLGVAVNLTYLGNDRYQANYDVYKWIIPPGGVGGLNVKRLPKLPFFGPNGVLKIESGHKIVTSNDTLVRTLLPERLPANCPHTPVHTFVSRFYGFPKVFICLSATQFHLKTGRAGLNTALALPFPSTWGSS